MTIFSQTAYWASDQNCRLLYGSPAEGGPHDDLLCLYNTLEGGGPRDRSPHCITSSDGTSLTTLNVVCWFFEVDCRLLQDKTNS